MTAGLLPEDRVTITVDEAARLLGIARTTPFQAVRSGELPAIRVSRRILIPVAQLNALLQGPA
jgi:excisionase family DNA binding protein